MSSQVSTDIEQHVPYGQNRIKVPANLSIRLSSICWQGEKDAN